MSGHNSHPWTQRCVRLDAVKFVTSHQRFKVGTRISTLTPNGFARSYLPVTHRDDLEFVAGLGIATAMGGSEVAPGSNPRRYQKG